MFKNELAFSQSYTLSKKERKDIFKKLKQVYLPEAIDYITQHFENLTIHKTSINGDKKRVIFLDSNPILFEHDHDNYLPTVYLLQMFSGELKLMSRFCLIYDETDTYLENGADLMLKGVLNREEIKTGQSFRLNDLFYVITTSGHVTSLGISMSSTGTLNIAIPSGKFLKIIHRIGDGLWQMGNKKNQVPVTLPIKAQIEVPSTAQEVPEIAASSDIISTSNPEVAITCTTTPEVVITSTTSEDINITCEQENETQQQKEDESSTNVVITSHVISEDEMDKNIDTIFLHLLKLAITDDMLPLDPGKMLKEYMRPLAEEMKINLDFKQSSHKKINNYLKFMHKEKEVIHFGKPKGIDNDYILTIMRNNLILKEFKPMIRKIKFLDEKTKKDNSEGDRENILLSKDEKIEVSMMYKPNQKIKPLFEKYDPDFDGNEYYDLKYCTDLLAKYLKENNLFSKTQKGMVILNETLEKLLSIKIDYNHVSPLVSQTYKIEDVLAMWKSNLNSKSFITKSTYEDNQTNTEIISNSKPFEVKIIAKKINNKNVTIVDGLQNFINIKDATKTFAKHFATSVTIKDINGIKDAIFIQGYWVTELLEILQAEIKLEKKYIKVEDKLNKIKKKK